MAYDGSNPSWDIVMYDDIADAMKVITKETGANIRWGIKKYGVSFNNAIYKFRNFCYDKNTHKKESR